MRSRFSRLALVAVGGLVALSCRSTTEPLALRTAIFVARWQGQDWQGKASAALWRDSLYLSGVRQVSESNGSYQEAVRIRVAFHGVGQYVLDSTAVEILQIVGGDGISGSYAGVGANAGVLDVTANDGPGGSVTGTVHFEARRGNNRSGPILSFENGQFRAPFAPN